MRATFILISVLIISASGLSGQESSQSTLKFEFLNGYWVVSVNAKNSMATNALRTNDKNLDLTDLGVKGFHNYYREYLIEHIEFKIDSIQQSLNFVALEINSAKANGQFISNRRENPGKILSIQSDAFASLGDHTTKVVVIHDDEKHVKWLTADDKYSCEFTFE